jgi:hypothetical protein
MPLLTPECIIFMLFFLKTPGRKDARTPEKPFFTLILPHAKTMQKYNLFNKYLLYAYFPAC